MRRFISTVAALVVISTTVTAQPYPGRHGINLGDVPFVDLIKSTNGYQTTGGQPLSNYDADGWPQQDFRLTLLDSRPVAEWNSDIDDPEEYRKDLSGTYKGSFTGQATVTKNWGTFTISNVNYTSATNTTTFDLNIPAPSTGYCFIVMSFGNTQRTSGSGTNTGITNLRIIRPGYGTNPTKVVTDEFIAALTSARFSCIRGVGFTGTGMMPVTYPARTTWDSRKKLTDASWRPHAGKLDNAPWEVFIDICNEAGMDMWANVPISADSMYVRELATLIRDRLDDALNVYIEIDNEVWGFDNPKNYNQAESDAKALPNPLVNFTQRIAEAALTFEDVFGVGSLTNRVRPLVEWWILNRGDVRNMLNYINGNYRTVNEMIYGAGPAMYFSVGSEMENDASATIHELSLNMYRAIDDERGSRESWVSTIGQFNLKGGLVAYEGGPHTPSANTPNAPNLATKITMHRTEYMPAQMLYNARENFIEIGMNMFMHFTLSGDYCRYGAWGLTDDLADPDRNYKFRAVRELIGDVSTPIPPGYFQALIDGPSTVTLYWEDRSDNETGFVVERVDSATGAPVGTPDTLPANTETFVDNGVSSMSIFYRLKAINANGHSTYTRQLPVVGSRIVYEPRRTPQPLTPVTAASEAGMDVQVRVYSLDGRRVLVTDQRALQDLPQRLSAGLHVVEAVGVRGRRRVMSAVE